MIPKEVATFFTVTCCVIFSLCGFLYGCKKTNVAWEKVCIMRGVAEYTHDEDGGVIWRWKGE